MALEVGTGGLHRPRPGGATWEAEPREGRPVVQGVRLLSPRLTERVELWALVGGLGAGSEDPQESAALGREDSTSEGVPASLPSRSGFTQQEPDREGRRTSRRRRAVL